MRVKTSTLLLAALASSAAGQQIAELTASDAAKHNFFGKSVAVSGVNVVVGADRDDDLKNNAGAVYLFELVDGVWTEHPQLFASNGDKGDYLGSSVAISGTTVVAGAPGWATKHGTAYVFVRSGGVWTEEAILGTGDTGDLYGAAVAASADTAVVGASLDDDLATDAGVVHVYVRNAGIWTLEAALTASDGALEDELGAAVSIDGDTLVAGAPRADHVADGAGAVYAFTRTAGVWTEQAKLTASDASADAGFGSAVAVSGDTLIVGAVGDDAGGVNAGAAYVFTRSGGVWTERAKLVASQPKALESFGRSVDLDDGLAVIGADGANDSGASSGAAYVFTGAGASWAEVNRLLPQEGGLSDFFGSTVSVSGDLVAVGSGWDDDDADNSGSAHLFVPLLDVGELYCSPAAINSTGLPGVIAGTGSTSVDLNVLDLSATQLPGGEFAVLWTSPRRGGAVQYGGAPTGLCIGAPFGTFHTTAGTTDGAGGIVFPVDLTSVQTWLGPVAVQAGETWNFQVAYRDGATMRFTDALGIGFD